MLMLYGPDTPSRSRAEMEALAALPGIESGLLGRGTLGMAEELAGDIASLIDDFLSVNPPHPSGRNPGRSGVAAAGKR
jgi:hypothetical protein